MLGVYDYRLIKRVVNGSTFYHVHRVFYTDESKKTPVLIERYPSTIEGLVPKEMIEDLELMIEAFKQPTLYIPEGNGLYDFILKG